ncbi:hypothetical protein E2C01_083584 [Portunus trituberculatus]|uniref:Uncharacterized protein n=1 Tax=Portunus trituberculatus TaxID=210409 RepID=A0A5B7J3W6_PORTR|nr:hypothetical protein [Portunus trituberculatus]
MEDIFEMGKSNLRGHSLKIAERRAEEKQTKERQKAYQPLLKRKKQRAGERDELKTTCKPSDSKEVNEGNQPDG